MTMGQELLAWTRTLRSRFAKGCRAHGAAPMTLLAQRRTSGFWAVSVSLRSLRLQSLSAEVRPALVPAPGQLRPLLMRLLAARTWQAPRRQASGGAALVPRPVRERQQLRFGEPRPEAAVRGRIAAPRLEWTRRSELAQRVVHSSGRHLITQHSVRETTLRRLQLSTRQELPNRPPALLLRSRKPVQDPAAATRAIEVSQHVVEPRRAQSPEAATPDVDWIANRVIDQIDRRLVAYRERMGRV